MSSSKIRTCVLSALICLIGCTGARYPLGRRDSHRPARPKSSLAVQKGAESPFQADTGIVATAEDSESAEGPKPESQTEPVKATGRPSVNSRRALQITPVGHEVDRLDSDDSGTITIDGRTYRIRLVAESSRTQSPADQQQVHSASLQTTAIEGQTSEEIIVSDSSDHQGLPDPIPDATLMNLPSALSMVGGSHPAVGLAQWKVQEAYADLDQAGYLWLPSIQTGFSFHRHDGNYQASNGDIVDVNRSSFQYGFGAGATGAGTTPVPGLVARFHFADAIFAPDIALKTAWAMGHAEQAVVNRQLRDVALAYTRLLNAYQQQRILEDVQRRTAALSKITNDFASAGQGLKADADRLQTELSLVDGRIASAKENVDVMSARLAHALSADSGQRIIPIDPTVVPIALISPDVEQQALIRSGLTNRPELKELQAMVAAACDRYERQKYAPFVPSVLLGLSADRFGGDLGTSVNSVDGRYDFDAIVTWEIRNLGFGERSARRRTEAQVQQALYRKVKLIDDVAREISEAHHQVLHRRDRMSVTQRSIQSALDSYDRDLSRIRNGEGLPTEVMLSVKALEAAQSAYLESVVAYNEAQFQLQWAVGWQVSAPPEI